MDTRARSDEQSDRRGEVRLWDTRRVTLPRQKAPWRIMPFVSCARTHSNMPTLVLFRGRNTGDCVRAEFGTALSRAVRARDLRYLVYEALVSSQCASRALSHFCGVYLAQPDFDPVCWIAILVECALAVACVPAVPLAGLLCGSIGDLLTGARRCDDTIGAHMMYLTQLTSSVVSRAGMDLTFARGAYVATGVADHGRVVDRALLRAVLAKNPVDLMRAMLQLSFRSDSGPPPAVWRHLLNMQPTDPNIRRSLTAIDRCMRFMTPAGRCMLGQAAALLAWFSPGSLEVPGITKTHVNLWGQVCSSFGSVRSLCVELKAMKAQKRLAKRVDAVFRIRCLRLTSYFMPMMLLVCNFGVTSTTPRLAVNMRCLCDMLLRTQSGDKGSLFLCKAVQSALRMRVRQRVREGVSTMQRLAALGDHVNRYAVSPDELSEHDADVCKRHPSEGGCYICDRACRHAECKGMRAAGVGAQTGEPLFATRMSDSLAPPLWFDAVRGDTARLGHTLTRALERVFHRHAQGNAAFRVRGAGGGRRRHPPESSCRHQGWIPQSFVRRGGGVVDAVGAAGEALDGIAEGDDSDDCDDSENGDSKGSDSEHNGGELVSPGSTGSAGSTGSSVFGVSTASPVARLLATWRACAPVPAPPLLSPRRPPRPRRPPLNTSSRAPQFAPLPPLAGKLDA